MARHDDTHHQILDAALAVFAQCGWHGSLDAIAERAGVARQTLYNHFESKEQLFVAACKRVADVLWVPLNQGGTSLEARLNAFGCQWRGMVRSPQGLALHRMCVAELDRFPELRRSLYDASMGTTLTQLTSILQDAMARGELRRDDPAWAAENLLAMLEGFSPLRHLQTEAEPDGVTQARVQHTVRLFLHAYAWHDTPSTGVDPAADQTRQTDPTH